MKIYRLPVHSRFQPDRQNFMSPPHATQWGVEQDFEDWLRRSEYITDGPGQADYDYLPIFWNRIYCNWNWGQDGLDEIQSEILRLVSRNRPTFTICEYDIKAMQPFDLCGMLIFTSSRQCEGTGIDIPLLCSLHYAPTPQPGRRWLASFVGNLNTFSPRPEMAEALGDRADCHVEHADKGTGYFLSVLLDSYLALCPRGHGGQSFRFYEAMQVGIAPLLIGDLDTRPFKKWLPWDRVSLYQSDVAGLSEYLDRLVDKSELVDMGKRARDMYLHCLQFGQWPRYVIKELALI